MEFAFALVALFVFFGIYMLCVQVVVEHERLAFTGFVTARTFDVRGQVPALKAGQSVNPDAAIVFSGTRRIELSKPVYIPIILRPLFNTGSSAYTVEHASPAFDEQALLTRLRGDN